MCEKDEPQDQLLEDFDPELAKMRLTFFFFILHLVQLISPVLRLEGSPIETDH